MVRILLIQRHFWPDTGVPAMTLRALAARLAAEGHQVDVLAGSAPYRDVPRWSTPPRVELTCGFRVIRLRVPREHNGGLASRAVELVAFPLRVGWWLLPRGHHYHVVFVSSAPPVFLAAAVRTAAQLARRPYIYQCQDVNPEAALLSGVLRPGASTRLMARIDRRNIQRAAAVVVLSGDMAATLRERGVECRRLLVINNFIVAPDEEEEGSPPVEPEKAEGRFRVLFAGNLGLVQGLEAVIDGARRLQGFPEIEFVFMGAGAGEAALKERAGEMLGSSVAFIPHQPTAVALGAMRDADLGLVSLAPGIFRVAYPSKTLSYVAAGCPVLAVVEAESELAGLIETAGLGATCPPGDPAALADAVLRQRASGQGGQLDRSGIRAAGERYFGADQALERWSVLFEQAAAPVAAAGQDGDRG